jgi:hypothetical protein
MDSDWAVLALVGFAIAVTLVMAAGATLVVRDTVRRRGRWGINLNPVRCPACGEPAPAVRVPRNRHQALWGGHTCGACGQEYDKWGQAVDGGSEADG